MQSADFKQTVRRYRLLVMLLCDDVSMRTTLDLTDDAYHIAKAIAREEKRSMGRVVSDLITRVGTGAPAPPGEETGFPSFRCIRRVTSDDVKALDDEE